MLMFVGVLLIAIGLLTVVWGHWLAPRQLRRVREKATPAGRERYDSFMKRPAVDRLFRTPAPLGGLVVLIGLVYLITEL
jgi:hypothetical protein